MNSKRAGGMGQPCTAQESREFRATLAVLEAAFGLERNTTFVRVSEPDGWLCVTRNDETGAIRATRATFAPTTIRTASAEAHDVWLIGNMLHVAYEVFRINDRHVRLIAALLDDGGDEFPISAAAPPNMCRPMQVVA